MKKRPITLFFRRQYASLKNALVFLSVVIERGTPLRKWPTAWRKVQASRQAEVRRHLTQLTMSGRIKRRIKNNEFIYSPIEDDNGEK